MEGAGGAVSLEVGLSVMLLEEVGVGCDKEGSWSWLYYGIGLEWVVTSVESWSEDWSGLCDVLGLEWAVTT